MDLLERIPWLKNGRGAYRACSIFPRKKPGFFRASFSPPSMACGLAAPFSDKGADV